MFHDFVARSASSKTAPALGKLITVTAHRTTWGQNIGYEIAAIASSILEIVTYFAFQGLAALRGIHGLFRSHRLSLGRTSIRARPCHSGARSIALFHPDFNRRLRPLTGSADPPHL
jgi:hypothetical protein